MPQVLRCLMQMLQARASSIKSGWKPLVSVFRLAAREPHSACQCPLLRKLKLNGQLTPHGIKRRLIFS